MQLLLLFLLMAPKQKAQSLLLKGAVPCSYHRKSFILIPGTGSDTGKVIKVPEANRSDVVAFGEACIASMQQQNSKGLTRASSTGT